MAKIRRQQNPKIVDTPRPPAKKLIFTVLLALSWLNTIAQDNLESWQRPLSEYDSSLKMYYSKKWIAERTEFVNIQKGRAWDLVPSVGIVFGLPSVNLNTGQVANYFQKKNVAKQKLRSLDLTYELVYNEDLLKLKLLYHRATEKYTMVYLGKDAYETKEKIYKIHKEAFEKGEMKPLDHYKELLSIQTTRYEWQMGINEFHVIMREIELLSRWKLTEQKLETVKLSETK